MAPIPSGSDKYDTVIDLLSTESSENVPIDLHVCNMGYSVTDRPGKWWQKLTHFQMPWEWMDQGKTTHILSDVSFTAKSGKLMAIMGGSGSGKTSLLDVLACRTNVGEVTGDIYLNSVVRTKAILDSCSGYVRQDDRLIAPLTVRETLMFVALLKLPRTFSQDKIRNRVDRVIADLGLKHAAETKIGDAHIRGLSGGERRRVSIGVQLLILPSILFLDEPTSGLDAFTANNLALTLSRLACKQRTILMSIHQPRFDIFDIVDHLMILSKGRIVYNGPGKEMVSYFSSLGFPSPIHTNPCDFYIDLATVDSTSKDRETESLAVVESLHAAYRASEMADSYGVEGDMVPPGDSQNQNSSPRPESMKKTRSGDTLRNLIGAYEQRRASPRAFTQFLILFRRSVRVTMDNYPALLTHVIQACLMSLLLGVVYVELKYDQNSIRDWFGVQFMVSVMYPYMVLLGLIGECHEERRYLYFELQDKLYTTTAFFFAKVLSAVPFHLFYVLIYCIPVYLMAGLELEPYSCGMFFLFVSVSVFTSRCLAMMAAAVFPTFQISCFFAQTIFSLFIMSAGFILNLDNMLAETKWISLISYLRWGFQALCIIQVEQLEFTCTRNETLAKICTRNGTMAMETFALRNGDLGLCAAGIGAPMAVMLVLMWTGLRFVPQKPMNE